MVRVGELTNGNGSSGRGSPSEVFSRDFMDRHPKKDNRCMKAALILAGALAVVFLLTTVILAIVVGVKVSDDKHEAAAAAAETTSASSVTKPPAPVEAPQTVDETPRAEPLQWPKPSGSLYAHYRKAAVASDHGLCSEIGRDVLFEGGNAVDATIASLLCIGVVNPQSSGLGGGFLMTLYNASTGRCVSINARETAPAAATSTMFVNHTKDSVTGYKAIAIPSELHGFWTAFTRFGSTKISWSRLVEPSIQLAMNGFPVSANLAMVLTEKEKEILADPSMSDIFVDPTTSRVYEEGDVLKRQSLGFTLQLLANATDPVELFYQGGLAQTIAAEIQEHGGIVTAADLASYQTEVEESPLENDQLPEDLAICGPPPPSSFAITQSIVSVMAEFYGKGQPLDLDDPLVYHRLIEAEKFAYAQRTRLGDWNFVESAKELVNNMTTRSYAKWIKSLIKDEAQSQDYYSLGETTQVPDHGTSHITVLDEEGNAVSCTSTVNQIFGSMRASPTLGIVWNDEMDDFSTPGVSNAFGFAPSPENFIAPGKRPMSSMSPSVVYNKNTGKVRLVVGASGGSFIISATAQTVVRALLFNQTIKEAVDAPRLHNQFLPFVTQYENSIPKPLIATLVGDFKQNMTAVVKQKSVVQALEVMEDGYIHGNSDFRRQTATYPAGF